MLYQVFSCRNLSQPVKCGSLLEKNEKAHGKKRKNNENEQDQREKLEGAELSGSMLKSSLLNMGS